MTQHAYPAYHAVTQYNATATTTRRIYTPSIDRPVTTIRPDDKSKNRYYYHQDRLASPIAMTKCHVHARFRPIS